MTRRRIRFQPSGKLEPEAEAPDEITPPDKLQQIVYDDGSPDVFPGLESLFTAPLGDLRPLLRNKSELAVLENIGHLITRLSELIQSLSKYLRSDSDAERDTNAMEHEQDSSGSHSSECGSMDSVAQTMGQIAECLSELAFQKRSLTQYEEMNSSLSEELIEQNCHQLAKDKRVLADIETLLAKRLDSLFFAGPPYRSFSTSWKEIIESHRPSNTSRPQSPLAQGYRSPTGEDRRLSESPRDYDSDSMAQSPASMDSDDDDDELSNRTKALVRSTQETLIAFESSGSSGNSLSSPSPNHDLRRTSSEIAPHPAQKRVRGEDVWPSTKRRKSHSFNETLSPDHHTSQSQRRSFSPKPIRLTPLSTLKD